MRPLLDVLLVLLIPMGLFPVIVSLILGRHINSGSMALKERARLSVVLAGLGIVVSLIAANVVYKLGIDMMWLWLLFAFMLLLIDGACAIWLYVYFRGDLGSRQ